MVDTLYIVYARVYSIKIWNKKFNTANHFHRICTKGNFEYEWAMLFTGRPTVKEGSWGPGEDDGYFRWCIYAMRGYVDSYHAYHKCKFIVWYTVECTVNCILCTVTVQCTECEHCILHKVYTLCTVYCVHCLLNAGHIINHKPNTLYIVYCVQCICTLCAVCTIHCILCAVYMYTVHCVHYTLCAVYMYTVYCVHYTLYTYVHCLYYAVYNIQCT